MPQGVWPTGICNKKVHLVSEAVPVKIDFYEIFDLHCTLNVENARTCVLEYWLLEYAIKSAPPIRSSSCDYRFLMKNAHKS